MFWSRFLEVTGIIFGGIILIYMVIVVFFYMAMLLVAFFQIRKRYKLDTSKIAEENIGAAHAKPVSIIVPAHNEETGIVDSIHSLLSLQYPETEVIIVDDGSTDRTLEKIIQQFQMKKVTKVVGKEIPTKRIHQVYQSIIHPNLWLVHKEKGGKADALNAGINVATYPYFCSIDGDSILDSVSLLRVMNPIVISNGDVIAAGGNVRIANGTNVHLGKVFRENLSRNSLVVMQIVEYLRAFLMGRISLSKFNLILIISGAFSVFSRKWVLKVGGYSTQMVGEDMELVVKLHRYLKENKIKKRIEFVSDPICWTEAPEKLSDLRKQRRRWHQGLVESLWKHKRMTLNPKYGAIGMISFPFFWLVECLGPIIELGGYVYIIISFCLGNIYYEFAILLALLLVLYGVVLSAFSVLLGAWSEDAYPEIGDFLRLLFMAFTEIFWYKPITLLWRCEGFICFILGRNEWGNMQRIGLSKKGLQQ
ncbi:MAG TPA: glycosyltransferase family 2 protein [Chondromyces sp.]|nr:glycosyltransferase family 2 protein [Chondromyces sp.]